jgi:hypothetical protein
MDRRIVPRLKVIVLVAIGLLPLSHQALSAEEERKNLAGFELTALVQPLGSQDPYSGPLGLGLFYERHRLLWMFYLGGQVSYYGFYPLWAGFGESSMLIGGIKLGYDLFFRIERRFALTLSPYLSGSYYWRRFVFQNTSLPAWRPILGAGVDIDLYVRRNLLIGLDLGFLLVFDERVRWTVGGGERLGVHF